MYATMLKALNQQSAPIGNITDKKMFSFRNPSPMLPRFMSGIVSRTSMNTGMKIRIGIQNNSFAKRCSRRGFAILAANSSVVDCDIGNFGGTYGFPMSFGATRRLGRMTRLTELPPVNLPCVKPLSATPVQPSVSRAFRDLEIFQGMTECT